MNDILIKNIMLNNPKKFELSYLQQLSYLQLTAINHASEMKKEKEFCIKNNKPRIRISNEYPEPQF